MDDRFRSKGEAGTGDASNATTHMRQIRAELLKAELLKLAALPEDELYVAAKELQAPYDLGKEVASTGKLPVLLFIAGGIATPADAAVVRATAFYDEAITSSVVLGLESRIRMPPYWGN
ncbi:pyridoxal biosynthesis lyase PdxS [Arthrobacter sp. V4I6]|nr:pyridoxal biosynthesis lyase PdxS [Arthrobacter sp. V1I7]MDQ0852774.1 pyridoxal biosynthesis lyase PdxS [Arthrobacter sp. V4I6]